MSKPKQLLTIDQQPTFCKVGASTQQVISIAKFSLKNAHLIGQITTELNTFKKEKPCSTN
jgi:hypothetical protein